MTRESQGLLLRDPGLVEAGVDPAEADELGVVPPLDDAASVDDDHLVGGLRRGEPVRDGDRGATSRVSESRARWSRTSVLGSTADVASSSTSRSGSAR